MSRGHRDGRVKTQVAGPSPRVSVSEGLGTSHRFPGDLLAGGPDCRSIEMTAAQGEAGCCLYLHLSEDQGPLRTNDSPTLPATLPGLQLPLEMDP